MLRGNLAMLTQIGKKRSIIDMPEFHSLLFNTLPMIGAEFVI